ncbi:MAG: four-carbon acid sugar kinase family protein [Oscillospiraceae bacterium]
MNTDIAAPLPGSEFTPELRRRIDRRLHELLRLQNPTIVVLDDDPTGVQTVHGVPVYTDYSDQSMQDAFEKERMFYLLTNSRSLTAAQSERMHREIAAQIAKFSKKYNKNFILISRGDSTLRGHYPLETDTLRHTLEKELGMFFSGEIVCPAFFEGGRFTVNNIHYLENGGQILPVGESEFSKDKTFGYKSSSLCGWIAEKSNGATLAKEVVAFQLADLSSIEKCNETFSVLTGTKKFTRFVVNATNYYHLKCFAISVLMALGKGYNFIFRTAASLPKVLGGISDQPLLSPEAILQNEKENPHGGIVVVGSHVNKTTRQLAALRRLSSLNFIEFNQHLVLEEAKFKQEIARVQGALARNVENGKDTVVYTNRNRLDFGGQNSEEELLLAGKISAALTGFVAGLNTRPRYIIAKGGITSSDIGTLALGAKKAMVLGQVLPGVPVWQTGAESKFPGIAYIIFPGNVGEDTSLQTIVEMLQK